MSVYDVDLQTQNELLFPEFVKFPKLYRFFRDIIITEKIDGINAQIVITDNGDVHAGTRNQYITSAKDHHGFAAWVEENHVSLFEDLGFGQHNGEWWGLGIQRRYDIDEKRFSLFNTTRWFKSTFNTTQLHVVPVLYTGPMDSIVIRNVSYALQTGGSLAAPDFMNPEGIVIFHTDANLCFKYTGDGDGHKG